MDYLLLFNNMPFTNFIFLWDRLLKTSQQGFLFELLSWNHVTWAKWCKYYNFTGDIKRKIQTKGLSQDKMSWHWPSNTLMEVQAVVLCCCGRTARRYISAHITGCSGAEGASEAEVVSACADDPLLCLGSIRALRYSSA